MNTPRITTVSFNIDIDLRTTSIVRGSTFSDNQSQKYRGVTLNVPVSPRINIEGVRSSIELRLVSQNHVFSKFVDFQTSTTRFPNDSKLSKTYTLQLEDGVLVFRLSDTTLPDFLRLEKDLEIILGEHQQYKVVQEARQQGRNLENPFANLPEGVQRYVPTQKIYIKSLFVF